MARDMVQVRRSRTNQFLEEPSVRIGRSQFDRSHGHKTTFDSSDLIPILLDEVLPGDTVTCKLTGFARIFSPLDAPIMDNIALETFFFFVPNRILWEHWEDMNGAHDAAGAQDTDYTVPIVNTGATIAQGDLGHYFGLPVGLQTAQVDVSAVPFRAYREIYNEWFRDQNLIAPLSNSRGDGPDANTVVGSAAIQQSAKKHDYFTSCLPYLQKGDPVTTSIGTTAPIYGIGALDQVPSGSSGTVYETGASAGDPYAYYWTSTEIALEADNATGAYPLVYADLTAATGVSINALRESVAIQRLLERDARGGTRYVEIIKSHFGVTSPDYRLQRPEYLGGGKAFINVSPVANTSATATEDQGELRGIGTGLISGHGWAKSFTEHGYIIGLVRARGDLSYFQGLDRHWSRSTRYDFYIPALANLGEQSVLNKELYVSNSSATDDAVFGYQERWAEYRYKKSVISGKLDPNASGALSHWHLAEDFASLPSLNQTFIEDSTPMSRVTTVDTEPDFLMDVWFDYKWARPIPVHSIPSLVARF